MVTGAGRGLGASIARSLADGGARVFVNDIDRDLAARTVSEIEERGGEAIALTGDVSSSVSVDELVGHVIDREGRIDWLVNNVASYVRHAGSFWETDPEEWERILRLTLTTTFLCSRAAAPHMVQRQSGRIVNIASQAAFSYVPWQGPHYHAAKAGVVHLTRTMAVELAPHGVTVNAMSPTAIEREGDHEGSAVRDAERGAIIDHIPLGRLARAEEAVAAVAFLLSDQASFVTGETLVVNGGVLGYGIRPPGGPVP
ncbi:SDR family oxidoreductase [Streptomyces bathyalis]|uniref:SDR family oxidoreductase n=2 Tax=Streptomyces bathyalis TaxID=2710756 RepID=A0A7T1WV34_9ACTN|nr:SDR family oxidoreductase [Streptomyces bathyalis]